jgi:hypothetical protein
MLGAAGDNRGWNWMLEPPEPEEEERIGSAGWVCGIRVSDAGRRSYILLLLLGL